MKLMGEKLVEDYHRLGAFDYTIIRPTAVYGPSDGNRRVLRIFLENALRGKPLVVRGRDSRLDFTWVEDTAEGIVLATLRPEASKKVFNISRGVSRTLGEAASIIAELVPGTDIRYEDSDSRMPSRGALESATTMR